MLTLHGFRTQNSLKTLYTLEELGTTYEFRFVDLFKGEHKRPEFQKLNPVGKVPVLQTEDGNLFESGAICRYVANLSSSPLYPQGKFQRALVDQWMDFMSCHLGRWFNTLYFEQAIKATVGMGEPNQAAVDEATTFASQQLKMLDGHLQSKQYFLGEQLTIADLFAYAYIEQAAAVEFSLDEYPEVSRWLQSIAARESIARAKAKMVQS
ncbi:MAG: glutathione S-transferase family protein [Oceanococcus sp.]